MKRAAIALVALLMLLSISAFSQTVPATMNFQGRLAKRDGTPVPDANYTLTFTLYDALTGGNALWMQTLSANTHNGALSVLLGAGTNGTQTGPLNASLFGGARWLEIKINNGPALSPRQSFSSLAYAFHSSIADMASAVPANSVTNSNIVSVDWSKITNAPSVSNIWTLIGNAGTNPATNFLGTTDNQPIEVHVNSKRVLRLEPAHHVYDTTHNYYYDGSNVIGGYSDNSITPGVVAGTIAGGGCIDTYWPMLYFPNRVTDTACTVGGGVNNVAGSDNNNPGDANWATVAGGNANTASGALSMIPGGLSNVASGVASFAAGFYAQSLHDGSFVWADISSATAFPSTNTNQFRIRATNGLQVMGAATSSRTNYMDGILTIHGTDFSLTGRGAGAGNNGGLGRALVDAGINQPGAGATGLHINYKNDFGQVNIDSDTYIGGNVIANGVILSSDARYKTHIAPLNNALDDVLNLRGVSYNWDREKWPAKHFPEGKQIGFIAQELEKIFPELVQTDANGYKSVMYQNVTPILVEAIKTQEKRIRTLEADNVELKRQMTEIQKQNADIADLKKQLAELLTERQEKPRN